MISRCGAGRWRSDGFSLIELMIVVTIISILASIAIPVFAQLLRKSSEGAGKGNLGSLRAALGIYYSDNDGHYPSDMLGLTAASKYLPAIPLAKVPNYHLNSSALTNGPMVFADGGAWLYDNVPGDAHLGDVYVDCTHTDTRGSVWTTY